MPDGPWRYKLLPRGALGTPPIGVPYEAHRQAEYVVAWLQKELDWAHGVEIRWFEAAGTTDRDGDLGVFVSHQPLRGCVDPADPMTARLNVALCRRPTAHLIRSTVHEALHCDQLARQLDVRRSPEELERLTEDCVAILCRGLH